MLRPIIMLTWVALKSKEILTSVFTTTFMGLKNLRTVIEKLKRLPNALRQIGEKREMINPIQVFFFRKRMISFSFSTSTFFYGQT